MIDQAIKPWAQEEFPGFFTCTGHPLSDKEIGVEVPGPKWPILAIYWEHGMVSAGSVANIANPNCRGWTPTVPNHRFRQMVRNFVQTKSIPRYLDLNIEDPLLFEKLSAFVEEELGVGANR